MRSRYTAYVARNDGYLLRTWHPSTRPYGLDPDGQPEWCGLEILRTEDGGERDNTGMVEFVATAMIGQKVHRLHEVSRFVREQGLWLYVDGKSSGEGQEAVAGAGKVGRNELCPCNSGKKFKKCCGR
jgi:SEC-C motif-containing protein